jgi:hypothetical protein
VEGLKLPLGIKAVAFVDLRHGDHDPLGTTTGMAPAWPSVSLNSNESGANIAHGV